ISVPSAPCCTSANIHRTTASQSRNGSRTKSSKAGKHLMSDTMDHKARTVTAPEPASARPSRVRNFDPLKPPTDKPQSYYDDIKRKFAEERDLRLGYRPEGKAQYITNLDDDADLAKYETDPFAEPFKERAPITDTVEVLCIG